MTLEMYVGRLYSQALNYFGVALQRTGQTAAAVPYYDLALKLDPYSAPAMVNAEFNRTLTTGRSEALKQSADIAWKGWAKLVFAGEAALMGQRDTRRDVGGCIAVAEEAGIRRPVRH